MSLTDLPVGTAPIALPVDYFPTPFLAVIWRNWNLVSCKRLAQVLATDPETIRYCGKLMGLVPDTRALRHWQKRGYLTIIRRNWQLLDYGQLLILLGWTAEQLAFTLREEDFFWTKLGELKPTVSEKVYYRPLTPKEFSRCAEIREIVLSQKKITGTPTEIPFEFLDRYGKHPATGSKHSSYGLRMIYSYSALFGDPLLEEENDSYPETLLAEYANSGINAVWLQGILYTLVPWTDDEKSSRHWQKRLAALKKLVARAGKYGIKVFLYFNEPRAMPPACESFKRHPDWGGATTGNGQLRTFCIHSPEMLQAFENGVKSLCSEIPELGGFLAITMSENWTHCLSRSQQELAFPCPRCTGNSPAENVIAVLQAVVRGIAAAGTCQEIIAWSWQWSTEWDEEVLAALPPQVKIMCVSEYALPTLSEGIPGVVNDYSISQVGPGNVAKRLWALAIRHGHSALAKIQMNNSWELSAIPYLPVPQLVAEHIRRIKMCGITNFLQSWTLGGYPGGNLELTDISLEEWAAQRFPDKDIPVILAVTAKFSEAFTHFPLHETALLYFGPQNLGCANPLYAEPTHYRATMVGFPYDDLPSWCGGHFSGEVLEESFRKLTVLWEGALETLRNVPASPGKNDLWVMAESAYCHFRSTYCQIRFIRLRNAGKYHECLPIVREEINLATRMLKMVQTDSRIGFEAGNQYAYTANDLLEKIINCYAIYRQFSEKEESHHA